MSEESEKRPGYMERIKSLKQLINQTKLIQEAYKKAGELGSFEAFQKEFLAKMKKGNNKDDSICNIF